LNQISLQKVERRLDQGVLYFQNVKIFYVTRVSVIEFKPKRKVWPSLRRISGNFKMLNIITWRFMTPTPNWKINVKSAYGSSFTPENDERLSLHLF